MNVLLVEDEERIAAFMAKGLRRGSHHVEVIGEGLPAVGALAEPDCQHDVLVLDLGLPDIDGLEVLRRIRESGSVVPAIIVTARSGVADQLRASELGVSDYLVKPFPLTLLLASLDRLAETSSP